MATRIQLTEDQTNQTNLRLTPRYSQHIGKEVYLFDSVFNGNTYIHVRKLLNNKIPTKDGISLTLQRCNELFISLSYLDSAVNLMELNQETFYRRHLGGNWHVSVESGFKCVDIRQFWLPEGASEMRATRKGVSLTFQQYKELRNGLSVIDSFVPELRDVVPCYADPTHDVTSCSECTPSKPV
ncbi:Transcriptional coactivator [Mactra antiquata]